MSDYFRIIKIIDTNRVVVNAGKSDVKKGKILEVFSKGEPVIDPETNEELGTLDFIKAYLEVQDVFPKMCVCINNEKENTSLLAFADSFKHSSPKPLYIDTEDISGGYDDMTHKIKVGDPVRFSS